MSDDATITPAPAAESLTDQVSIELPNGVIATGAGEGADADALVDAIEQRHDALNPQADKPARVPRGQKRFDELTAQREAEKRRADAAEARARELEARLSQPVAPQQSTQPQATPQQPAQPQYTRPMPQEAEIGTKYKSLTDYFVDLSNWNYEQREAALFSTFDARLQAGIEADRATRTRVDHAQNIFAAGRTAYPDFDATLAAVEDIKVPPSHQDAILKMPNAERIMYALAKNRPALEALVKEADPVLIGVQLATLGVTRTEAVAPVPASTPVAVRTTNAPAPPQPVSGGSRTARASSADIANSGGSYEQFKAARASEMGRTH